MSAAKEKVIDKRVEVLLEVGSEEIPAGMLPKAEEDLRANLEKLLAAENLSDGVTVETFDERLTTVSAARSLTDAGRTGRQQRTRIDQAAAAVLLQAWLDAQRGRDRA